MLNFNILKEKLPLNIINFIKTIKHNINKLMFQFTFHETQHNYRKTIESLMAKQKIRIAFFVVQESVWKCDYIYKHFLKDDFFEPVIVVIPYIVRTPEVMLKEMEKTFQFFSKKGYKTFKTYNEKTNTWLDVKKEIKPDIVFFTNPYEGLTRPEYYINAWLDRLTCYIPYFYGTTSVPKRFYNNPLQNLVWTYFCDSEKQKKTICKVAYSEGKNLYVSGYAGFDELINNPIKKNNSKIKIIWSPHHSIDGFTSEGVKQSCFLELAEFMKRLPTIYKNIDFVFKPHPLLINHLGIHKDWGKERTEKYYSFWNHSLPNVSLELGDYVELFKTSDAMIHDCGSFRFEYLTVNKPCLYCLKSLSVLDDVDEETRIMFKNCYYIAQKQEDIINFIEKIILQQNDLKKDSRTNYIKNNLIPLNNKSASLNIYYYIKSSINGK